jgi:hypothetical protein
LLCYGLPAPAGTLSFNLSILKIQAKVNKQLVGDSAISTIKKKVGKSSGGQASEMG